MPISEDQWNKGRIQESIDDLVEDFLLQRRSEAFTMTEIAYEIFNLELNSEWGKRFSASWVVQKSLDNLVNEGRVKVAPVEDENGFIMNYYKIT